VEWVDVLVQDSFAFAAVVRVHLGSEVQSLPEHQWWGMESNMRLLVDQG
jgi:hypothetical protein